ncbi:MAG: acyl-CoA desaturase [Gemmatimonadales bacterium]|nr:MAG: acyl-CoA desaturase [Gemmatimonadales bacterium]
MSSEAQATAHTDAHHHHHDEEHNDIVYPAAIPFVLVHLAAFGVFWTGFTVTSVILCISLYVIRMWALTAGFHRYFSHRSYKTSRAFQFFLAFLGQTSAQRGVLWWSAIHRHHHRHSDTHLDVHSPKHTGFWFSHVGWIFSPQKNEADYDTVKDLSKYPELRFLDRHAYFPAVMLGIACYLIAGWSGLFVGFILSTVILYHGVFSINSLAHVVGKKRYVTADDSRNNWWLAILTLGEGWHNNHHHYQSSTRQGFFWWEIDISYYVLKVMSWFGLVWDLREPPKEVVLGEQRLGRKVIEKMAEDVAESYPLDSIAARVREAWNHKPSLDELRQRATKRKDEAVAQLMELDLPHVPSIDEIKRDLQVRLEDHYRNSPSLDDIAERAREIIVERLSHGLLGTAEPQGA